MANTPNISINLSPDRMGSFRQLGSMNKIFGLSKSKITGVIKEKLKLQQPLKMSTLSYVRETGRQMSLNPQVSRRPAGKRTVSIINSNLLEKIITTINKRSSLTDIFQKGLVKTAIKTRKIHLIEKTRKTNQQKVVEKIASQLGLAKSAADTPMDVEAKRLIGMLFEEIGRKKEEDRIEEFEEEEEEEEEQAEDYVVPKFERQVISERRTRTSLIIKSLDTDRKIYELQPKETKHKIIRAVKLRQKLSFQKRIPRVAVAPFIKVTEAKIYAEGSSVSEHIIPEQVTIDKSEREGLAQLTALMTVKKVKTVPIPPKANQKGKEILTKIEKERDISPTLTPLESIKTKQKLFATNYRRGLRKDSKTFLDERGEVKVIDVPFLSDIGEIKKDVSPKDPEFPKPLVSPKYTESPKSDVSPKYTESPKSEESPKYSEPYKTEKYLETIKIKKYSNYPESDKTDESIMYSEFPKRDESLRSKERKKRDIIEKSSNANDKLQLLKKKELGPRDPGSPFEFRITGTRFPKNSTLITPIMSGKQDKLNKYEKQDSSKSYALKSINWEFEAELKNKSSIDEVQGQSRGDIAKARQKDKHLDNLDHKTNQLFAKKEKHTLDVLKYGHKTKTVEKQDLEEKMKRRKESIKILWKEYADALIEDGIITESISQKQKRRSLLLKRLSEVFLKDRLYNKIRNLLNQFGENNYDEQHEFKFLMKKAKEIEDKRNELKDKALNQAIKILEEQASSLKTSKQHKEEREVKTTPSPPIMKPCISGRESSFEIDSRKETAIKETTMDDILRMKGFRGPVKNRGKVIWIHKPRFIDFFKPVETKRRKLYEPTETTSETNLKSADEKKFQKTEERNFLIESDDGKITVTRPCRNKDHVGCRVSQKHEVIYNKVNRGFMKYFGRLNSQPLNSY